MKAKTECDCNYCIYKRYKKKYGKRLKVVVGLPTGSGNTKWRELYVDGKHTGVSLMQIGKQCEGRYI